MNELPAINLIPPDEYQRRRAQDDKLRKMVERSPKLLKQLRVARRKQTAQQNGTGTRTQHNEMKRSLLAHVRRATGQPTMQWKAAKKWLKRHAT